MMVLLIVTVTSMLLAAIMSAIAWRIAGDERRRSDARVAALSAEIHGIGQAESYENGPADTTRHADIDLIAPREGRFADLFAPRQGRFQSRPFFAFACGSLVFGAVVAMAILAGGVARRAPRAATPVAVAGAPAAPIELVALGHERVGDDLTVRGVIRTSSSGTGVDRLTAVVLLFTPDGGFLASGRAAVGAPALQPGGESTFVVTVPRAGDVGRYRVSFRTDERVVPHLDRRHES